MSCGSCGSGGSVTLNESAYLAVSGWYGVPSLTNSLYFLAFSSNPKVSSLMIFKSLVVYSITSAHSRNGSWLGLGLVSTAPPPSTQ